MDRLGHTHPFQENPAFNPYNDQTGSVWPHDNAIIAFGFKHDGFGAEAARIAHDISVAASHFKLNQLPELYTAFSQRRNQLSGAVPRRKRAAGLGRRLSLHAGPGDVGFPAGRPAQQAVRRPVAPDVATYLVVHDLRVGQHKIDIRFWREDEQTAFEVTKGDPQLVERCDLPSKFAQLRTGSSDPI